jgi:2-polyprenyl-6-hydroxyphenyl methylase/3-demethylubiquinone-9 3-methyltransferase
MADELRFGFGSNWASFLRTLDDERIAEAERSLCAALGKDAIAGRRFLDIGSGSGLFSLAAHRLGAARVHSFDYDTDSVQCTAELRRRYANDSSAWAVERGSALDRAYLTAIGSFDIVYSWGVLHHTGDLWTALDNVTGLVEPGGVLYISIYNDQGRKSQAWRRLKQTFNRNRVLRWLIEAVFVPYWTVRGAVVDLLRLRNPLARYRAYKRARGMSMFHDWIDWLGGYPFEVARPEQVFDFIRGRGFTLQHMVTCGGTMACNEFVFVRNR